MQIGRIGPTDAEAQCDCGRERDAEPKRRRGGQFRRFGTAAGSPFASVGRRIAGKKEMQPEQRRLLQQLKKIKPRQVRAKFGRSPDAGHKNQERHPEHSRNNASGGPRAEISYKRAANHKCPYTVKRANGCDS